MTSILKTTVALLFSATIATSCTNQDVLFGNELIPPAQGLETVIDSSMKVKASTFMIDSIVSSNNNGLVFLGSIWNPTIGLTTANVWTTYIPGAIHTNDSPYLLGKDPVLDSMYMLLNINNVKGDTSLKLKISVHEIKDTALNYLGTYNTKFKGDKFYDHTPIFEFELSGGARFIQKHLPREYFQHLLYNEKDPLTNPYYSDELFIKTFKGFLFKVQPIAAPAAGAMYRLNMASSTLSLHYHNKNEVPDTTQINFQFYVDGRRSVNFYTAENDFTLADPAQGGVIKSEIGDSTIQPEVLYVTGMVGLGAQVVIDTAYLEQLRQKTIAAGYKNIAIHRASIRWYLKEPSPETYKWIPTRLCLYYKFNLSVPDYNAYQEAANPNSPSDIGGYINRSNGYYEQVITSTLQQLINKNPNAKSTVQLLPSVPENYNYSYVKLNGTSASSVSAPTMVIVYTMLK